MDDYLFLVMAKLKTDRLQVERELRHELRLAAPDAYRNERHVEALRASELRGIRRSSSNVEWREQS